MSIINQAVILCGGLGTRLKPLTKKLPKPMVQINNKPFLQYLVEQCSQNGIKNFLLLCGYKHEKIKIFFEHFQSLPSWFTNLWILVVASIYGIKGTQIFKGKK